MSPTAAIGPQFCADKSAFRPGFRARCSSEPPPKEAGTSVPAKSGRGAEVPPLFLATSPGTRHAVDNSQIHPPGDPSARTACTTFELWAKCRPSAATHKSSQVPARGNPPRERREGPRFCSRFPALTSRATPPELVSPPELPPELRRLNRELDVAYLSCRTTRQRKPAAR